MCTDDMVNSRICTGMQLSAGAVANMLKACRPLHPYVFQHNHSCWGSSTIFSGEQLILPVSVFCAGQGMMHCGVLGS